MRKAVTNIAKSRPTIVGAGLIALDVVLTESGDWLMAAGGTCGNVMAIMSHLGWIAKPISRLGCDRAAGVVRDDLSLWGVDLSLFSVQPVKKTPVIVERIRRDANGVPFHTFSFYCPACNRRFPGFQPLPLKSLAPVLESLGRCEVVFIDRVSPSAVELARMGADRGAVVIFEPPRSSGDKHFQSLLSLATIVKYSHDRIDQLDLPKSAEVFIEIQTLGRGGVRFRTQHDSFSRGWHHLQAERVEDIVDSSGCGDWFTAGLIASLCSKGRNAAYKSKKEDILEAFVVAQALAAWNCKFAGARGGMYSPKLAQIRSIFKNEHSRVRLTGKTPKLDVEDIAVAQVCGDCHVTPQTALAVRPRMRA
jgi:sugar/nucleoside kinase (ribokinase family)